jgi:GNAT superfamily N-acetyltransferase
MIQDRNFIPNTPPVTSRAIAARLGRADRPALLAHFLALSGEDRRLRFGAAAPDAALAAYVERIDFRRDGVFAVHDEALRIVAAVHVALGSGPAELGLSVLPGWRSKGHGDALLKRAVTWLRNRRVLAVYVHCLTENAAMMHLARRNGMRIVYSGNESDGRLELEGPTPQSLLSEFVADHCAAFVRNSRRQARLAHALLGG